MPTVLKSGSIKLLEPSGPVQACNGMDLSLHTTNNDAVNILTTVESNNKIISEYATHCKECVKKLSFLSKALALCIAGPKDKLFQMLTSHNKQERYILTIDKQLKTLRNNRNIY